MQHSTLETVSENAPLADSAQIVIGDQEIFEARVGSAVAAVAEAEPPTVHRPS